MDQFDLPYPYSNYKFESAMEAPQSSFEVGGLDLSFMDKYKDEMQKGIEEID